jgi:hypothetical protein
MQWQELIRFHDQLISIERKHHRKAISLPTKTNFAASLKMKQN